MVIVKKHWVLLLLVFGFLIRFCLIFVNFSFDVNNHISWAQDAFRNGLAGFYETQSKEVYGSFYPVYPPMAIFSFCFFYGLLPIISKLVWWLNIALPIFPSKIVFFIQNREFVAGLLKIPAILSDLGIAYFCYLIAKKVFPKKPMIHQLALLLILFNPVFIYNSSLWGQIDSLAIFFLIGSVYFVFIEKHLLSLIFFVLAALVKPTIFIVLPIYGLFFLKKFGWKKIIKDFFIGNFVFWWIFLPFYKTGNLFLYPYVTFYKISALAQVMNSVNISAFNLWSLFPKLYKVNDQVTLMGKLSYQNISFLIAGIFIIIILFLYIKRNKNNGAFFEATFLLNLTVFLFLTRMHERYIIYSLPFFLLFALNDQQLIKWFVTFSLVAFFNLFYSWAAFKVFFLINIIKNPVSVFLFSLFNLFVFFYFLKKFLLNQDKQRVKLK